MRSKNEVRTMAGVPPVTAFAAVDGTPLVIDTDTQYGYYLGPDGVVRPLLPRYAEGLFFDTTTQIDGVGVAHAINFNTTVVSEGVRVVDLNKLYVDATGRYNWQISIQITNADTQIQDFDLWGRVNGVDIPFSNTRFSVPNSHGGAPGALCPALNFWMDLTAGDYVNVMWSATSNLVKIETLPAGTAPVRPAAPGVILTVNQVAS